MELRSWGIYWLGVWHIFNSFSSPSNLLNYSHLTGEACKALEGQNEESPLASFTLTLNS